MNIFRVTRSKVISMVITLALMLGLVFPASAMALPVKDWEGHWAQEVIESWLDKGLVSGYEDGSIQPNKNISRVEFMAFANRAFNFNEKANVSFKDVASGDWYYEVVQNAVSAGYIAGYTDGTMKPNNAINRQEAAAILAKITGLSANESATSRFSDQAQIPQWSRGAVGAVAEASLMVGYTDGSFMPGKEITRSEAIAALNNAMGFGTRFDKAGTYGPDSGSETYTGNVVVLVKDVTLQNIIIKGNLVLDKGIGEGDVTLNNVTVEGDTFVRGGGANSIHINGGQYKEIFIEKQEGRVRIVATNAEGIKVVIEAAVEDSDREVILEGEFESVVVAAPKLKVTVQGETTIKSLEVKETAVNSNINLSGKVTVQKAILEARASFTGEGTIVEASGSKAKDTSYEREPIIIKEDVTSAPVGGGGGGGGGTPALAVSNIRIILAGGTKVDSVDNLDGNVRVEGIVFDVSAEDSILNVTGIRPTSGSAISYEFTSEALPKSQATVTFLDILGKSSISLGDLRGFFGSELTIEGTLSKDGYRDYSTGFTVELGGKNDGAYNNDWVTLSYEDDEIVATIKDGKENVQLEGSGMLSFFMEIFDGLDGKVKVGVNEYSIPGDIEGIKTDFAGKKLSDLAEMDIKIQKSGSEVWYTLEIV